LAGVQKAGAQSPFLKEAEPWGERDELGSSLTSKKLGTFLEPAEVYPKMGEIGRALEVFQALLFIAETRGTFSLDRQQVRELRKGIFRSSSLGFGWTFGQADAKKEKKERN